MNERQPISSGDWSFETLLAHVQSMIDANDRRYEQRFMDSRTAVDAALSAAKEAVVKAEVAADKRFESVNEFRATLSDQQRMLMPRTEAEMRFRALEDKLDLLMNANIDRRGQQAGLRNSWGFIAGAIGIALAIWTLILRFLKP